MKRTFIAAGLATLLAATGAQAQVIYTFDTDNQGWTVGDTATPTPSLGNFAAAWANGKLVIGDSFNQTGVYAPGAVLGNQSGAYGGSITFDVSDASNDGIPYAALVLYGANGKAATVEAGPPSTDNNALTTYSFTLNETVFSSFTGGYHAGGPISQADFQGILANLAGIAFTTEYKSGPDDSRFDNAIFRGFVDPNAPISPIPEPASWAMMIAGFGAIGASLRMRRTRIRFA